MFVESACDVCQYHGFHFLSWAYVRQGGSIFGCMVRLGYQFLAYCTPSLPIFGIILGILEMTEDA